MTGYKEEKRKAQDIGSKALKTYKKLSDQLNSEKITEDEYYEKMQKEVYDRLIDSGFEYVHRGGGSDGLTLQFGRYLSDAETEQRNGEEWVQEWIIGEDDWLVWDPEHDY